MLRENRLYQADWLLRYYGFTALEIAESSDNGMLDLSIDPKLAWALKNRHRFPADVNTADKELLQRVPGLGVRAVEKIIAARRHTRLRLEDIRRVSPGVKRSLPFLITADHHPGATLDQSGLRARIAPKSEQLSLL